MILDDGAVVRLDDDEFFVTVTTGNTAALERWITWWNADWQLDARVLNVTGAFGAVNLAGPRARSVMAALTDADVSGEAMPYMSATRIEVAGVPSLVLRIGFVGEMGYEIHFPSAYGEHMWDAILEAGAAGGIAAFGLEAQRILRLEKQHILVGQDTDAESDPFEVGLGWMVKEDKDDFLGLRALRDLKEQGPQERLVGFTASDGWLPPEGASVVRDGSVGRPGDVGEAERRRRERHRPRLGPGGSGLRRPHVRDPVRREPHAQAPCETAPFYDPHGAEAAIVRAAIRRSPAARLSSHRGAVFAEEAGWEIPASYGDDEAERGAIRDRVAIADVTARAKVDVRGRIPDALPTPADTVLARISAEWAVMLGATGCGGEA